MTLEEALQDAARKGEFSHLSIIADGRGKTAGFSVIFKAVAGQTCQTFDRDPAKAIADALVSINKAKRVGAPRKPPAAAAEAPAPEPAKTKPAAPTAAPVPDYSDLL